MNYRLDYWNQLFKDLIDWHMVNGNHFDFTYTDGRDNIVSSKRVDHESDTPWPLLRYEFHLGKKAVVYKVDNQPKGGTVTTLVSITGDDGLLRVINGARDEVNEQILREVYHFVVDMFDTFWFD